MPRGLVGRLFEPFRRYVEAIGARRRSGRWTGSGGKGVRPNPETQVVEPGLGRGAPDAGDRAEALRTVAKGTAADDTVTDESG